MRIIFLSILFLGCGADDYIVPQPKGQTRVEKPGSPDVAYTFGKMKRSCFGCHNATAPKIPLDEDGFKASSKVKARIKDGTMPPSQSDWDIKKALDYLDS